MILASRSGREFALRLLISCFFVLQLHLSLVAVLHYLASTSLFHLIPIAGVTMVATLGFGRVCRGLFGTPAYAPITVFFHAIFLWGVYASLVRGAMTSLQEAAMNLEFVLLMFGLYRMLPSHLCRIIFSDPGVVSNDFSDPELIPLRSTPESKDPSEGPLPLTRVRFCRRCNANVLGFDHHCPAFGNCIGTKNHRLFMALLVGFIVTEASYVLFSVQFISKSGGETLAMIDLGGTLVISTIIFSFLQIIWQVIFLIWHVYCICVNIRTDEWVRNQPHPQPNSPHIHLNLIQIFTRRIKINWRKYPEFQADSQSDPGTNPAQESKISTSKSLLTATGPRQANRRSETRSTTASSPTSENFSNLAGAKYRVQSHGGAEGHNSMKAVVFRGQRRQPSPLTTVGYGGLELAVTSTITSMGALASSISQSLLATWTLIRPPMEVDLGKRTVGRRAQWPEAGSKPKVQSWRGSTLFRPQRKNQAGGGSRGPNPGRVMIDFHSLQTALARTSDRTGRKDRTSSIRSLLSLLNWLSSPVA
ncbi:uncharacterized protein LOC144700157 isoform X2 [Wolffia australiana]